MQISVCLDFRPDQNKRQPPCRRPRHAHYAEGQSQYAEQRRGLRMAPSSGEPPLNDVHPILKYLPGFMGTFSTHTTNHSCCRIWGQIPSHTHCEHHLWMVLSWARLPLRVYSAVKRFGASAEQFRRPFVRRVCRDDSQHKSGGWKTLTSGCAEWKLHPLEVGADLRRLFQEEC